jgi:hypothetical protein
VPQGASDFPDFLAHFPFGTLGFSLQLQPAKERLIALAAAHFGHTGSLSYAAALDGLYSETIFFPLTFARELAESLPLQFAPELAVSLSYKAEAVLRLV